MTHTRLGGLVLGATIACAQGLGGAALSDWTQFGGPTRDFMVDSKGLASSWPASGPRQLWSRALGDGHSSIIVDGARLFTDVPAAQHVRQARRTRKRWSSPSTPGPGRRCGSPGTAAPSRAWTSRAGSARHSTPLVVGDRLFAATTRRELVAFDKTSGKRLWGHDLHRVRRAARGQLSRRLFVQPDRL